MFDAGLLWEGRINDQDPAGKLRWKRLRRYVCIKDESIMERARKLPW
jgi:hypothetical protein